MTAKQNAKPLLPKYGYTYKKLNRAVGRALHRYRMISDGDCIAVGLSGGKDSFTLMEVLWERKSRVPVDYELIGLHIDPGFTGSFSGPLARYCNEKGYPIRVESTDYGVVAHGPENRENPCFFCSRLRRKRLFELADELGCNKLALGHCKDDIIETLFINICYAGKISTMVPAQPMFGGKFSVIRPLAFVDKETIVRYARECRFPRFDNPCPTSKTSKRTEIRALLSELYRSNPKVKGNIFRAMSRVKLEYLLVP